MPKSTDSVDGWRNDLRIERLRTHGILPLTVSRFTAAPVSAGLVTTYHAARVGFGRPLETAALVTLEPDQKVPHDYDDPVQ